MIAGWRYGFSSDSLDAVFDVDVRRLFTGLGVPGEMILFLIREPYASSAARFVLGFRNVSVI